MMKKNIFLLAFIGVGVNSPLSGMNKKLDGLTDIVLGVAHVPVAWAGAAILVPFGGAPAGVLLGAATLNGVRMLKDGFAKLGGKDYEALFCNERKERNEIVHQLDVARAEFSAERDIRNQYVDKLNAEYVAKAQLAVQLDEARAEFRAERRDFNAERGIRNQLQADLNAERADKAQIQQRALAARQDATIQKFQLYQYAAQLEADLQAANAEGEIRYQLQRDLGEERDHRALIQMQRDDLQSDYNMASADRVEVEAQLAQVRNAQEGSTAQKFQLYQHAAQLEEALQAAHEQIAAKDQNAIEVALGIGELEEENDALRQQLQLMQKQLADSQKIIRKQSDTNKRAVNKLQALQRAAKK